MSRSLARLHSSTRCILPVPSGSILAPPRTTSVLRRCLHASARSHPIISTHSNCLEHKSLPLTRHSHTAAQQQQRDEPVLDDGMRDIPPYVADSSAVPSLPETQSSSSSINIQGTPAQADDSRFARHLNEQFAPLKFPSELARRILTHGSHKKATDGHNARLSFLGRRTLHAYLILFLHSSPVADPTHDFEYIASRALNTYALGQHVAPKWNLGRTLRWQPAVNSGQRPDLGYDIKGRVGKDGDEELAVALRAHPTLMRSVGLYKVMGEAVQAIIGGVYHQFGASVAHRLFHQRILPHLLIRGPLGLHEAYHADAYNKAKALDSGSKDGLLRARGSD